MPTRRARRTTVPTVRGAGCDPRRTVVPTQRRASVSPPGISYANEKSCARIMLAQLKRAQEGDKFGSHIATAQRHSDVGLEMTQGVTGCHPRSLDRLDEDP